MGSLKQLYHEARARQQQMGLDLHGYVMVNAPAGHLQELRFNPNGIHLVMRRNNSEPPRCNSRRDRTIYRLVERKWDS